MGSPELMPTAGTPPWLLAENLRLEGRKTETLRQLLEFLSGRQGATRELAQCLLGRPHSLPTPRTPCVFS